MPSISLNTAVFMPAWEIGRQFMLTVFVYSSWLACVFVRVCLGKRYVFTVVQYKLIHEGIGKNIKYI
jgi:hypothetical protein